MSLNPRYDHLVRDMARSLGQDPEAVIRDKGLLLEGFIIALAYEGSDGFGDILFITELGTPLPNREQEVHRSMLAANNFWVSTGGATLGIQAETGCAVLCGRFNVDLLDGDQLALLLRHFSYIARVWQLVVTDCVPVGAPLPSLHATRV